MKYFKFLITRSDKVIFAISISVILLNIIFSLYHLFLGDIYFHTDISRDLLLVEDVITERSLILIGPRAGGIPGTFFGPIWIYLMVPFYLFGAGNPIFIGYFYFLMCLLAIISIGFVTYKVFSWKAALIATSIFSFYIVNLSMGFTQSFGSVILSPFILYFIYLFTLKQKLKYLLVLFFLHGFLLQFQPAFGIITLAISIIIVTFYLFKSKKLKYLFSVLIVFIPLVNYIVFELRHDFLQIRGLINFLNPTSETLIDIKYSAILINRFESLMGRLNLLQSGYIIGFIFIILFLFIFYKAYKLNKKDNKRKFILLFYAYLFSFFTLTLFFKNYIWDFYTLGFLSLTVIMFSSLIYLIRLKIFIILYLFMIIFLLNSNYSFISGLRELSTNNTLSWKFNLRVAEHVFKNSFDDFGYFIYSPDEFGYSIKYAMNYVQNSYSNSGTLCKKEKITYLIYNPYYLDPSSPEYWKNNKVKINIEPVSIATIGSVIIEKYNLDEENRAVAHDPNIICDLHFR